MPLCSPIPHPSNKRDLETPASLCVPGLGSAFPSCFRVVDCLAGGNIPTARQLRLSSLQLRVGEVVLKWEWGEMEEKVASRG